MGKNSDKTYKIFDKFSRDFINTVETYYLTFVDTKGHRLDLENMYVCPLSLRAYHINDIHKLTIEHVPQKSLNGKPLVLTDQEFNNTDGHTKDKKILEFFKFRNFKVGAEPIQAKFSAPGIIEGKISGILATSKGSNKVKIGFPENTVMMLEDRGLFRNWDGLKMNIKVHYTNLPNKNALLKAAYLIAFSKIGYRLLFNKKGFKDRSYGAIITELQKENVDDHFPFVFTDTLNVNIPDEIGIIETDDLKLLVVKVRYKLNGQEYAYHVMLPHPEDEDLDNLIKFRDIYVQQSVEITIRSVNRGYLLQ